MRTITKLFVLLFCLLPAIVFAQGSIKMPVLYTDGMVLQRNKPIRIQGTTTPGEKVTVSIANRHKETSADVSGHWQVTLKAMPAGGPYQLNITSGPDTLSFKDVMLGEVWLCSGQSNMAFSIGESAEKKEALAHVNEKPIRLFNMKRNLRPSDSAWGTKTQEEANQLQLYTPTNWEKASAHNLSSFSAVGYAFGEMLADSLKDITIGLIANAISGSPAEAWVGRSEIEKDTLLSKILNNWMENPLIDSWCRKRGKNNLRKATDPNQRHYFEPSYLFEAGVLSLAPYTMRGIIWYQGESNTHNPEMYEKLFPALVRSWRNCWKEELPFYYVQLTSINRPTWPHFRNLQRELMYHIPRTGMIVTHDKGDSLDVHPKQKKEIGRRLAHWALNREYKFSCLPSGPLYRSMKCKGNQAILTFDYADGLTTTDHQPIRSFEVAGENGIFYPAQATIKKKRIILTSPKVDKICKVRYAWQPVTHANLINREGLPASTFKVE